MTRLDPRHRPSSRDRLASLARACERGLVGVGLLCLGVYAIACAHGSMFQANEAALFDAALLSRIHAEDPDTTAWSPARIRQYEEASEGPVRAMARLEVPDASLSVMVLGGTDEWTLNRAVGHIDGTARPGEPGNVGIAGHRDGFFRGLQHVESGDAISLTTLDGVTHYQVTAIEIVEPTAVEVLSPGERDALTLVTCYPFYYVGDAPLRYIVKAHKVGFETHASARP